MRSEVGYLRSGIRRLALVTVLSLTEIAFGGVADYLLKPPLPVPGAETYSPVSGGFNGAPVYAYDVSGTAVYETESISVGMIASEAGNSTVVGSFVQPPSGFAVDWSATVAAFAKSDAETNGYAFYTAMGDQNKRFAVSRCGSFEINWISIGGTTNTVAYQANAPETVVPHRLYWTSEGFNCPGVTLPKNYGVRLFGNQGLFWDESHTNAYGVGIYDYGVHYSKSDSAIFAYATMVNGEPNGPEGFFVVAYYDSGLCERLLGFTVVEVARPDSLYLNATVGSEVRPQNENYDYSSGKYLPVVQNKQSSASSSSTTYFHYQQAQAGRYHKKENRIFAIAETPEGEYGAKDAEICWEASDDFNVFWPFELTCYNITWPNCPTVVVGSGSELGPGVTVPDTYSVSLLDWRQPRSDVATVPDNENRVKVAWAGRFCLKLENAAKDDFWFVPLKSELNTNTEVFPVGTVMGWPIGNEVLPQAINQLKLDERIAELLRTVDAEAPGYIYETESKGHNWNRNLYHAVGASAEATSGDTTFASLVSTVHFVSVTKQDVDAEVWWTRSYQTGDMPEPVTFPVLPQRYKAIWPGDTGVQDIVIASTQGSATGGRRTSGESLFLSSNKSHGTFDFDMSSGGTDAATVGFWFNANPAFDDASGATSTEGKVISVALGQLTFDLRVVRNIGSTTLCRLECGNVSTQFEAKADAWIPVYARVLNRRFSVGLGREFVDIGTLDDKETIPAGECMITVGDAAGNAATGVALGGLHVWNEALADDFLHVAATNSMAEVYGRAAVQIDFSNTVWSSTGVVYAQDNNSFRSFTGEGFSLCTPGCPRWDDGTFAVSDGVVPRAYYENDPNVWGYNPNEEHAFTLQNAEGKYVLYALRNDMNDVSNKPYVFVEYAENGRGAMRAFRLLAESDYYPWPNLTATSGTKITTISPLDRMPSGTCTNSYTRKNDADVGEGPVTYCDRTGALWARRNGILDHYVYYYGEQGFVCTADSNGALEGAVLPFLNLNDAYDWENDCGSGRERKEYTREMICSLTPTPITQTSVWPKGAPEMSIAQVLTTAEYGLPEIYNWKTAAITYPTCLSNQTDKSSRIVKLIDPTCAQTADIELTSDFPKEYGFKDGSSGDCFLKKGKYYFIGLPPVVSDRLYLDINAAGAGKARMTLVGDLHESVTGTSYLRVNSLSANDYNSITNFFASKSGSREQAGTEALITAITAIYNAGDREPSQQMEQNENSLVISYGPKDHYALVAAGEGSGYVTVIENDGPEAEGLPVNMYVINVGTNLYCGQILALTDPNNTLSEQLNILYTAPLGRSADNFYFEWYQVDAPGDGHTPTVPTFASDSPTEKPGGDGVWLGYDTQRSGDGKSCIEAVNPAAASLNELVNRYWTLHYRAKTNTVAYAITEGRWSVWCEPALAEGWVQRVLNAITPFAQRTADFYNNTIDTRMTIPAQIGPPWQGDVALNNENVANVGLMELYRTILNKAESMSIAREGAKSGSVSSAANKQLILAASRLVDFHMLLGSEAYADAKNPIVGSMNGTTFSGSVFAFANQVDSLLDEELALLRGRTSKTSPSTWTYPCYNRLIWNYTKGMTQGEMAYVNNYDIVAVNGQDTAETAAAQYPQGHGDAYGYYLSAVTEFYRLLRNPAFVWGEASMMEMLVADKIVNVDYEEEDKFADAAYRLAKTGADIVDLTVRKQWRDNADDLLSGYFDSTSISNNAGIPQAMGYGEIACRSGFGALCNWAVANTLLKDGPETAERYFTDSSIDCVTRKNCASLVSLAGVVKEVERSVNGIDAGINPLCISPNAVPFDISQQALDGAVDDVSALVRESHYGDIHIRVERALANCNTALAYAQQLGSQIATIHQEERTLTESTLDMEREYNKQLIAIYGRPFSDDIGPGKLYEQGYDGPDLYHYAYMDISAYGLDAINTNQIDCTLNLVSYEVMDDSGNWYAIAPTAVNQGAVRTNVLGSVKLTLTADGIVTKPKSYTGLRATEGSLQAAYRDFITAYVKAKNANALYESMVEKFGWRLQTARATLGENAKDYLNAATAYAKMKKSYSSKLASDIIALTCQEVSDAISIAWDYLSADVSGIVGVAVSAGDIPKEIAGAIATVADEIATAGACAAQISSATYDSKANIAEVDALLAELELECYGNRKEAIDELVEVGYEARDAAWSCQNAIAELLTAQQNYRAQLEAGTQVLEARNLARQRAASTAVTARYRDMFARVERNNALSKYSLAFDIAQRYVYMLAKVYDYETGLLTSDPAAGVAFLGQIIGTRALGSSGLVTDSSATDDGLYGILTRMDSNWTVLLGRLGVNNPSYDEKWHSLRYSNFRIAKDESADDRWREELANCWSDDIFADPRVARHCQPAPSSLKAVPGLVIPFSTTINAGKNFFGKTLMGDEEQYSPSAYATRILMAGVKFDGYDSLVVPGVNGLARNPQVYLVPTGTDYMRAPGSPQTILEFNVVDQVIPLPYTVGSAELNDVNWIATMKGLDGSADTFTTIRRHAQFPANGDATATARLVGRSVWNDGWLLVIPADSLNGNLETAKKRFLSGAVKDIEIGLQTYTRQGN